MANDIPTFTNYFYYDDGDLYWKMTNQRAGWYCTTNGYRMVDVEGKKYLEHRVIYSLFNDEIPDLIDHINQNKTDNRIENLRPSNKRANSFNSKVRSDNTSGIRGISFSKSNNKWFTYIWKYGKRISGGYFLSLEEAILSRQRLEEQHKSDIH